MDNMPYNSNWEKASIWEYLEKLDKRIRDIRGEFIENSIWIENILEDILSFAFVPSPLKQNEYERLEFIIEFLQKYPNEITFNIKIELL